jgi:hypothetical protein
MKKFVELDLASVLGLGISSPALAFITATVCSAVLPHLQDQAYPIIMMVLSALLAVFPVYNSKYVVPLKIVLWPIVTVVIFVSAWGSSSGLSAGEEMLNKNEIPVMAMMAPMEPVNTNISVDTNIWMYTDTDMDTVNARIPTEKLFKQDRLSGGFFKRLK